MKAARPLTASGQTIPATQNTAWGFWGTMKNLAPKAWPLAMRQIASATGQPLDLIRVFLDSAAGRHFADTVSDGLLQEEDLEPAIARAVKQWMEWTISHADARSFGVRVGTPYLKGCIISAAKPAPAALLAAIAREYLFIETLETQNRDRLDFHDCHVASIAGALAAAFEAGKQATALPAKKKATAARVTPAATRVSRISQVNKAIRHLGIELVKGKGYFWFDGDSVSLDEPNSVYVSSIGELTLERWVEEAEAAVKGAAR